jgi:predicted NBD/HSP70 family sugar kinase
MQRSRLVPYTALNRERPAEGRSVGEGNGRRPEDPQADRCRQHGVGLVRAINEQIVLEAVLAEGNVTRAGLARRTGLSKPTVSALVRILECCGLVQSQGIQLGSMGRPATVYSVNRLAGHTYAVDLGGSKLRAAVTDLFGDVLAEETVRTPQGQGQSLVNTIGDLYDDLTAKAGARPDATAAACIGVPGVVRPSEGQIGSAFNVPGLDQFPFKGALGDRLGMPVVIENDANLAAVGECWRGWGRGCDHFIFISIGTGIGMGIVIHGELYRGGTGGAGEVGFLPVVGDPFDPANVTHGPLENAAASGGIERRLEELLPEHPDTTLEIGSTVRDVFAAASRGDPLATELVDYESRLIALGLAAVNSVIDPQLVVLGGGIGSNPQLLGPVRECLSQLVPEPPEVQSSSLGERASLYGAIALAVHRIRHEVLRVRTNVNRAVVERSK